MARRDLQQSLPDLDLKRRPDKVQRRFAALLLSRLDPAMKRKICVVTGTRAEYGLLRWLMDAIAEDPDLELQLVVTGMHLSPEFGLTWQAIEQDGFHIDRKVEMLLSSAPLTNNASQFPVLATASDSWCPNVVLCTVPVW